MFVRAQIHGSGRAPSTFDRLPIERNAPSRRARRFAYIRSSYRSPLRKKLRAAQSVQSDPLRSHFYYGEFEYPVGGGIWYQGKHPPIITKELFDKVQIAMQRSAMPQGENKEFAFTKLIKCGGCGGGITADEKFKKLKDGGVNRHVYYMCTQKRSVDCKNPPINETNLIEELSKLLDQVDLDEIGMRQKIEDELTRYNRFRMGVLGAKQREKDIEIDVRNYAKYLLKEGTASEKRGLLLCLKNTLVLKDRKIMLE